MGDKSTPSFFFGDEMLSPPMSASSLGKESRLVDARLVETRLSDARLVETRLSDARPYSPLMPSIWEGKATHRTDNEHDDDGESSGYESGAPLSTEEKDPEFDAILRLTSSLHSFLLTEESKVASAVPIPQQPSLAPSLLSTGASANSTAIFSADLDKVHEWFRTELKDDTQRLMTVFSLVNLMPVWQQDFLVQLVSQRKQQGHRWLPKQQHPAAVPSGPLSWRRHQSQQQQSAFVKQHPAEAYATSEDQSHVPIYFSDFCSWLRHLRLHKYEPNLLPAATASARALLDWDDAALQDAGISALGARNKLLRVFEQIKTHYSLK